TGCRCRTVGQSGHTDGWGSVGLVKRLYGRSFFKCFDFCPWYYAVYFGFYCGAIDGNCSSLSSKTSERRRERSKKTGSDYPVAHHCHYLSSRTGIYYQFIPYFTGECFYDVQSNDVYYQLG